MAATEEQHTNPMGWLLTPLPGSGGMAAPDQRRNCRQGCSATNQVATKWRPEGHPGRLLLRRNPGGHSNALVGSSYVATLAAKLPYVAALRRSPPSRPWGAIRIIFSTFRKLFNIVFYIIFSFQ